MGQGSNQKSFRMNHNESVPILRVISSSSSVLCVAFTYGKSQENFA